MDLALSDMPADHALASDGALNLLAHLDTVYSFALTLAGDSDEAARLTERTLLTSHDRAAGTLGGNALRNWLLARCADAFAESVGAPPTAAVEGVPSPPTPVHALLLELPWEQRAAISLVDQLGLTYSAGADVLGMTVAEFRERLHNGRSALLESWRTPSAAEL